MPEILLPIKAGSKYCNRCDLLALDDDGWYCRGFDPHGLNPLKMSDSNIVRASECLEAEQKGRGQ